MDAATLSAESLNALLQDSGSREEIVELRSEPYAGHGLIADMRLVHLRWRDGREQQFLAKLPTVHAGSLAVARALSMYRRELGFYRELAQRTPVPTPPCLVASGDDRDFVLLLEYLAEARRGDQIQGLSLAEIRAVLRHLARMHAHWWNSAELAAETWLPAVGGAQMVGAIRALFGASWPVVQQNFGAQVPPFVVKFGNSFQEPMQQAMQALAREPLTLGHGDLRADNLLFSADAQHEPVFLDWQLCDRARPMRDVAYLISQGLPVAARRRHGAELVREYADELRRQGVKDYSNEHLAQDLRHAAVYLLAYGVITTGGVDHRDERGRRMVLTMLERSIAMAEDYGNLAR